MRARPESQALRTSRSKVTRLVSRPAGSVRAYVLRGEMFEPDRQRVSSLRCGPRRNNSNPAVRLLASVGPRTIYGGAGRIRLTKKVIL